MKLLLHAALLAFAGLVIGAAHSYYAPFRLVPENNPPEANSGGAGTEPEVKGSPDPSGLPKPEGAAPAPPAPEKPGQDDPPRTEAEQPNYFIDVDRAKQLFDRGQQQHDVYFVDARPAKDYTALHVAGAMHLPTEAFSGRPPQKAFDYLPGMTVVIYCHGATCTDSQRVMIGLQDMKRDIGPIYIMKDGFDTWKARGWPVEPGPDPLGR